MLGRLAILSRIVTRLCQSSERILYRPYRAESILLNTQGVALGLSL